MKVHEQFCSVAQKAEYTFEESWKPSTNHKASREGNMDILQCCQLCLLNNNKPLANTFLTISIQILNTSENVLIFQYFNTFDIYVLRIQIHQYF